MAIESLENGFLIQKRRNEMKVRISKQQEPEVRLSLRERCNGVDLIAYYDGVAKHLIQFNDDGSVSRYSHAEIGAFKFDSKGQLVID
jgi:hypothetical protein